MLTIRNQGQAIAETNYWDSEHAQAGALYLSWNAGAARLLVPDSEKSLIRELKGAREVIVSRGPWTQYGGRDALELLWEELCSNGRVVPEPATMEMKDRKN